MTDILLTALASIIPLAILGFFIVLLIVGIGCAIGGLIALVADAFRNDNLRP